ncbi:hypothetical protein AU476_26460 [Cupriavidus sp. UYMSc13B]|nr:hypothetical protein AU476_26460 [Cupriavidus sp. UYMSc13B]
MTHTSAHELRIMRAAPIHGHTRTSFDYCIDDSRVVCNPRGYVSRRTGELENKRFDWCCVVEV